MFEFWFWEGYWGFKIEDGMSVGSDISWLSFFFFFDVGWVCGVIICVFEKVIMESDK